MEILTMGQLAREAGVNVETIRYYERRGLLREPPRTGAGYRQYSTSDLWRLQFIARAKLLGFTLSEIGGFAGPDAARDAASIGRLAAAKMLSLEHRQRELTETRSRLERLIAVCKDPDDEDCTALRVTRSS
jgi:DNA-binding transcriptional MerR regulator